MRDANLSPKQRKALRSLLENGDIKAAAKDANVSRTTLYGWLRQPEFATALADAERETLKAITNESILAGRQAVRTIAEVLENPDAPTGDRLRAAGLILPNLLRLRDSLDYEERLARLEAVINGGQHGID